MSKINIGCWFKDQKKVSISAEILRKIVGPHLQMEPSKVVLSGFISLDKTWEYDQGVSYVKRFRETEIHTFNGKEWREISDGFVGGNSYTNGNHSQRYYEPKPIYTLLEGDEILIVVDDYGADDEGDKWRKVTAYAVPDLHDFHLMMYQNDIKRWEKWLSGSSAFREELADKFSINPEKIMLDRGTLSPDSSWISSEWGEDSYEKYEVYSLTANSTRNLSGIVGKYGDRIPNTLGRCIVGDEIFFVVTKERCDEDGSPKTVTLYRGKK